MTELAATGRKNANWKSHTLKTSVLGLGRDGPLEKSLQPVSESERIFHIVKKNRGELMKNVEADNEMYLLEQSLQPLTKSERIF